MTARPSLKLKTAAGKLFDVSESVGVPIVAVVWDDETKGCVVMVSESAGPAHKTALQDAIEVLKLELDQDGIQIPRELPA